MSTKRKLGYLFLVAFVLFWMVYGLREEVRNGVNGWVLDVAGPAAYNGLVNFTNGITSTVEYQTYHPILWVIGSAILFYAIHQIHAADKIPYFNSKKQKSTYPGVGNVQREPAEPEVAPKPKEIEVEAPTPKEAAATA